MLYSNGADNNRMSGDDIRFRTINHLFSVSDSYFISMAL